MELAKIRKKVADIQGNAVIARWNYDDLSVNFANLSNVAEIAVRGPLTKKLMIALIKIAENLNLIWSIGNLNKLN